MTTRTRASGIPGKEKRGTSPSNVAAAAATQRGRSPVPSKTNSPARNEDSGKRVPNYLKPTQSSGPDVSKQLGKKPVTASESAQKPTLARRRSFDKPPSPSRTQKTRVSPNPTLRSSSFSGKMSSAHKVGSDRSLKGLKDVGKQHTLYARPVNTGKRGITGTKKTGSGSSISKEQIASSPEKVHDLNIADIPEPEMQTEDQEIVNIEQVGYINEEGAKDSGFEDQEQEEGVKDSVSEDQEPENIEQTEAESDENESKIVTSEPSTNSEIQEAEIVAIDTCTVVEHDDDDDDASLSAKTDELEEKSEAEAQEEVEEQSMNEVNEINNTDENVARIEEVEETKLEQQQQQQQQEATELNEKEEAYESEETGKQEVVKQKAEEENEVQKTQVVENAVPRVQVVAHGKKDPALSNDVIEETASKLREQRKNKVKALAGAFETVISLQESK